MTETVSVTKQDNATYSVAVGDTNYTVTAQPEYVREISGTGVAEALIEASFQFLLDREPKTAILKMFDLSVIETYFPEYREKIQNYL